MKRTIIPTFKFLILLLTVLNLFFLSTSIFGKFMGSYVDYHLNPVMIPEELISIERIEGSSYSSVSFSATKIRDCPWVRTEWFYGNPEGNYVKVNMSHKEKPEIRELGLHVWDNTHVYLDPNDIRKDSFSISTHRCHIFWETKSIICNAHDK